MLHTYVISIMTIVLMSMMVVSIFLLLRVRSLLTAVLFSSVFTSLASAVYITMDAVDVAVTEIAIGAGISTVLLLGTLAAMNIKWNNLKDSYFSDYSVWVFLIIGTCISLAIVAILDMPSYGDPLSPAHNHVVQYYIQVSGEEIALPNIVTSILASYRGLDTLGETIVIFTAAIVFISLLGKPSGTKPETGELNLILDEDKFLNDFIDNDAELDQLNNYYRMDKNKLKHFEE